MFIIAHHWHLQPERRHKMAVNMDLVKLITEHPETGGSTLDFADGRPVLSVEHPRHFLEAIAPLPVVEPVPADAPASETAAADAETTAPKKGKAKAEAPAAEAAGAPAPNTETGSA
jgi:hypothetical protein